MDFYGSGGSIYMYIYLLNNIINDVLLLYICLYFLPITKPYYIPLLRTIKVIKQI